MSASPSPPRRRPLDQVAAEVPARRRHLRALRDGSARRGALVVPHPGRRSVSLLGGALELLRVGLVLLAAIRLEVLARRGAREAVASGARRATAHVDEGDGMDVWRSLF